MADVPAVKSGDWIFIPAPGGLSGRDVVVCNVRATEHIDVAGHLEVVYLDERDRAINVDVRWTGERWEFAHDGPDGGYADKYSRLGDCVRTLRLGRYR